MSVWEEKQLLRERIRLLKDQFSASQKKVSSTSIFEEIEKLSIFKSANVILLYWSMEHEVFTHDFIKKWSAGKKILLPAIYGNELKLKKFSGEKFMRKSNKFPVYEPDGEIFIDLGNVDLAIVPGVAFDKSLNRLGFGKAYYDKLLSGIPSYKIGVCFSFQMFDQIPYEETDVKMDLVIAK